MKPQRLNSQQAAAALIVELPPGHRDLIARHLLALSPDDLRLRFGRPMSELAVASYVRRLDFRRDAFFGAFDPDAALVGLAHLGFGPEAAELGLSVLPAARRQGLARILLERAIAHARARDAHELQLAFLPENDALRALAASVGMRRVSSPDGPMASLPLAPADPLARWREAIDAAIGNLDLGFRLAAAPATSA